MMCFQDTIFNKAKKFTQYDNHMINLYQNDINDGGLLIQNSNELKSFSFVKHFKINELTIYKCQNVNLIEVPTNIFDLTISHCTLVDLKGLQNMKQLITLELRYNGISDITILGQLTNLKQLYLSNNKISTIQIQNLDNLTSLNLGNNKLNDISAIQNMTNLVELQLSGNQIHDINVFQYLINLKQLYLSKNKVSNIDILSSLIHLQILDISHNNITNISSITVLTNLKELYLSSQNNLVDIHNVANLIQLSELILHDNQIIDIQSIQQLKQLQYLNVSNNKIIDFSPLNDHPNIEFYEMQDQITPTKQETLFSAKIFQIHLYTDTLLKISQAKENIMQKIEDSKVIICQNVKNAQYNQISMLQRACCLLNQLNM
ncbi:leucine_Rich Repeat (LRR)-containing protein [Hexamita inflata]|uniref:Partial n=1 Tax=Hexamita inflata TaxID=28002 RepID=A0AA86UPS8_9EUKA|nr:leucine Rich Repeat (LRR)-containing protein [Hexamita inflata]